MTEGALIGCVLGAFACAAPLIALATSDTPASGFIGFMFGPAAGIGAIVLGARTLRAANAEGHARLAPLTALLLGCVGIAAAVGLLVLAIEVWSHMN